MKLTAVFRKVPEGYIGFVEELPGANTQGKTLEEARVNLREAIEMTLEANRILAEESLVEEHEVIREHVRACHCIGMKRIDVIRHLERHGCEFLREGGNHTMYVNRRNRSLSAVPRHRELNRFPGDKDLQGSGDFSAIVGFLDHSGEKYRGSGTGLARRL